VAARRIHYEIEPMTLGNMRELCVRSLDVSCWLCHTRRCSTPIAGRIMSQCRRSGRAWCALAAGSSALMPGRTGKSSRRGRASPGCSGEAERQTAARAADPRRLTGRMHDVAHAAHGFIPEMLADLVRAGFAVSKPTTMHAGESLLRSCECTSPRQDGR
jgi:hypothetical protein